MSRRRDGTFRVVTLADTELETLTVDDLDEVSARRVSNLPSILFGAAGLACWTGRIWT